MKHWEENLFDDLLFADFHDPTFRLDVIDSIKNDIKNANDRCEVWITADGTPIHIEQMDSIHINNTINFLDRKIAYCKKWQIALNEEIRRRTSLTTLRKNNK